MRRNQEAALTLLEVLLAIAIMSVLTVLCYKVLTQVSTAKIIVEEIDQSMTVGNTVVTRIIRELQLASQVPTGGALIPRCDKGSVIAAPSTSTTASAAPTPAAGATPAAGTGGAISLIGEEHSQGLNNKGDEITFIAREGGQYLPDGGRHTGTVQITYRVMPSSTQNNSGIQTYALVRDEMPFIKNQAQACEQAIRFPITERLVSLEFNYYKKTTNDWHTEWGTPLSGSLRLPKLIDFTVKLLSESGRIETYSSAVAIRAS